MNSTAKSLITIIGTTGVGKSQFSIELAKALNGEIINGDSMQVYRGLDNITNKHPLEERENIPHHLLGHCAWSDEYSVQQFEKEALNIIDDIHARGKLPILVGGTHYYNQAVIFKNATLSTATGPRSGTDIDNPESNENCLEEKNKLTKEQVEILDGPTSIILQHLKEHDPLVAQKFHPNDGRRIRRALEIFYTTGIKPSTIYLQQKNNKSQNTQHQDELAQVESSDTNKNSKLSARFKTMVFWIWSEQEALNKRLDDRVDVMIKNGLESEIDEMYQEYSSLKNDSSTTSSNEPDLTKGVWQVIGFRQFLPWLETSKSDPSAFEAGVDEMKRNTRRYSKQQTKFMKNTLMPKINEVIAENKQEKETRNSSDQSEKENPSLVATILDATDLSQWKANVGLKGIKLAQAFVNNELENVVLIDGKEVSIEEKESQNHENKQTSNTKNSKGVDGDGSNSNEGSVNDSFSVLKKLLVTPKKFDETQWQTFTCDVCTREEQVFTHSSKQELTNQTTNVNTDTNSNTGTSISTSTNTNTNNELNTLLPINQISASTTISTPYIAVGKQNWELHLKSRKHKNMVQKLAKMKRNRLEIEKRKKAVESAQSAEST